MLQKRRRCNMPRAMGPKLTKDGLKTLPKLLKYLFKYYKGRMILVFTCLIISAIIGVLPSIILQRMIDEVVNPALKLIDSGYSVSAAFDQVRDTFLITAGIMIGAFIISIIASIIYTQVMSVIGQGFLNHLRKDMFGKMEKLPISYFDRNAHGDIMSRYTNDVDAIRQFVTQTLLQTCQAIITIIFVFIMMIYFSLWLALVSIVSTFIILHITKKIGGNSAKYSMAMQQSTGKAEGYIEEMMNGQKVVKSFNHEDLAKADFDIINDKLCEDSYKANYYGNILGPILNNFGNLIYILIAIVGVILSVNKATNIGIGAMIDSTLALVTVGTVATFLGMSKQFTNTINNVSQQLPMIALAMAGGARIFQLMDQDPEVDEGYVTLVKANIDENGNITETDERTHKWAWKYTHKTSGVTEYRELKGDILLDNVDFGYYPDKLVLHNIDIYAHPGQQIALVGATGAGKTTITNLINRFYDIADGKVRYDGININKIKKDDLRRSLAIVLQETSLFTGTVKENIRYGRLDATDEEVYEAAKTANAYDFITRLPNGFDTMLTHNGANLSQGQRQLIAIARAACADAPVMILDEATSSIDTRTEALVQEGMDKLMEGRTTFVIAHRLSTVRNSDCIMVLDQGRIIERGSHDDLIAKRGTYYQLYTGAFELE